ncbi:PREDICTED: loricrin-like [Ipomoea nil]|uniref:loricrin-like n=1 Tax=Ipomoea nil TaxID=35883 RepID=UPI0009018ECD|nr:PREDICTED: loricrin-like [Ipomoea nil]
MAGDVAMDDDLLGREEETRVITERNGESQRDEIALRRMGEGKQVTRRDDGGFLAGRTVRNSEVLPVEGVQRERGGGGNSGGVCWPSALNGVDGRIACEIGAVRMGGGRPVGGSEGGRRGSSTAAGGGGGCGGVDGSVGGLDTTGGGGCGVYAGRGG